MVSKQNMVNGEMTISGTTAEKTAYVTTSLVPFSVWMEEDTGFSYYWNGTAWIQN